MNLSATAQATLLLTSYFSKAGTEDAKPLTTAEWGRFAVWLKEKGMTPADLLTPDPRPLLAGWHDSRIATERILALLARGHSLALAIEKWQRAGLWVVTRSDLEYPKRLKARLRTDSPPVLFGCGDKALLDMGGIAVVGSRNADKADLTFTEKLGAKAAAQEIGIVSGGARGVDEAAMLGAMNAGGNVIGVMADSLLKAATSAKWRKGLMEGNLLLLSPFYPEAGFSAGNAMSRNKYIYCLADAAVVVHSGTKGGTISGAEENLKKQWVPLWVKPTQDKDAANKLLAEKGGRWCEEDIERLDLKQLFSAVPVVDCSIVKQTALFPVIEKQADLFSCQIRETDKADSEQYGRNLPKDDVKPAATAELAEDKPVDFYQLFVEETARLATDPVTVDELIAKTSLHKSQINDWLNRMAEEGLVKKFERPKRYQYHESKTG